MNAAMRLMFEPPQLDSEGTWAIRLRTGEHIRSPRSRELLGIGEEVRVTGTLREITECTLGAICRQAIAETSAAHPGLAIDFECWDEAPGAWDRARMHELVRALLDEAIDRSMVGEPVIVAVIDCSREVLLAVGSFGGAPMADVGCAAVRQMVRAQRGRLQLINDESGSVFHVWLPKGGRS